MKVIRDFTRFFWLSDPKKQESEYQNTPVAEDMKENIYVDNNTGCTQEVEAVNYYTEARSIMNATHFNLCSSSSNSPLLSEQAAQDSTADMNDIVNILGLKWNRV